jgi:hypothetical protein
LREPKRVKPPTREWNASLSLPDGTRVNVFGYQAVGGAIEVRYSPSGIRAVAARSGDYVYPADVRVSSNGTILYVKTAGLGAGILHETWLFEYDLASRRQLRRTQVDPAAVPPECPVGQSKTQVLE